MRVTEQKGKTCPTDQVEEAFVWNRPPRLFPQSEGSVWSHPWSTTTNGWLFAVDTNTLTVCGGVPTRRKNEDQGPSFPSPKSHETEVSGCAKIDWLRIQTYIVGLEVNKRRRVCFFSLQRECCGRRSAFKEADQNQHYSCWQGFPQKHLARTCKDKIQEAETFRRGIDISTDGYTSEGLSSRVTDSEK
jgi:hypothetical protein